MSKLTKNQRLALEKIEAGKTYSLKEAAALVKEISTTKTSRMNTDQQKVSEIFQSSKEKLQGDAELCLRHIADPKRSPLVEWTVIQAVELCIHG